MEGKLDLSWWQAKNSLDSTVEKVSISKMLLLDKSYSREEQAYVKKTGVCKVVQEESTSQPHHCKFTISFAIHSEMLSGQRIYNLSRLNLRSGYPGSTLMCNSVLSEYPCLKKKGRFPKLVWALAQNLAIPAERLFPRHGLLSPVLLIRPVSDTPSPIKSWLPYYWSAKPSLVRGGEQSWREALEVLFLVTVQCSTAHHWVHTYFEGLSKSTALTGNMDVFGVQRGCSVAHISAQFQRQSFLFKLLWIKLQKISLGLC